MYSYKLLEAPVECVGGCGTMVVKRLAGHCFTDPMCDACFHEVAPELADITLQQPATSVRLLLVRNAATCATCGDRLSGRIAGFHYGDALCVGCFRRQAPVLAALLLLDQAALEAASSRSDGSGLLIVAVQYAETLYRLDVNHPRDP